MMIRFATAEDIEAIVEAGAHALEVTRFGTFTYAPGRVAEMLKRLIEDEQGAHCLMVATNVEEKVIGCLIGRVEKHIFSDAPVASVILYAVLPQHRMGGAGLKLLTAFKQWAENRDAQELYVGVSSGIELAKTDRFLRRLGFQQAGGNYALSLGQG